ncbi:MAG: hypothetical protein KIT87_23760 [Anaerolineae bacterium]|nr:hypothetical protein [Anaerolineae bacterium]
MSPIALSPPTAVETDKPILTLKDITALPYEVRDEWVRRYLPPRLLKQFGIDPQTCLNPQGEKVVEHSGSPASGEIKIVVWRSLRDRDPVALAEAADTSTDQIELRFLMTNDPDAPRFDVDVDAAGHSTLLGTAGRNVPAEIAAIEAGLAPGQVRRGLGLVLKDILPHFESFLTEIGHDLVLAVPLAYHNAILMEHWGFDYLYGRRVMEEINHRFQQGGDLRARLDGSTPFRRPEMADTVRGRSWAIHDGILGEPLEPMKMVKRVGHHAQIKTFKGPY